MTEKPKTAEEIIRQTLGLETALQAAEVYNEVLKAMEAFHQSKRVEDEEIEKMAKQYISDVKPELPQQALCQLDFINGAKAMRDRIFNK